MTHGDNQPYQTHELGRINAVQGREGAERGEDRHHPSRSAQKRSPVSTYTQLQDVVDDAYAQLQAQTPFFARVRFAPGPCVCESCVFAALKGGAT